MFEVPGPVGSDGHQPSSSQRPGSQEPVAGRHTSAPLLVAAAGVAAFLALIAGLAYRQIATYEDLLSRATQLYAVDVGTHAVSPIVPDENHWYWGPAWSPDGRRLVYSLALPDAKSTELMIANADGSNPRPLTKNGRSNYLPS